MARMDKTSIIIEEINIISDYVRQKKYFLSPAAPAPPASPHTGTG